MTKRILNLLGVLALTALTAGAGCGPSGRLPLTHAEGKVSYQGKPLAGALIVLVPLGSAEAEAVRPSAVTGADGAFRLSTYTRDDGVPPGEYAVSITWRGPQTAGTPSADAHVLALSPAPDYFRGRYAEPKKSGLRLKVEPEGGELPTIILP